MADIPSTVRPKLVRQFSRSGCEYPALKLTLVALKAERSLEVWSDDAYGNPRLVAQYPILAASGTSGPKLAQGDCQVPEGIYKVTWLNPNSRFHLSMKINYPNSFDRKKGVCDGRDCLGDNIFIHGKDVSIGCIAIGDEAIEELFQMVYDMGGAPVKVVIAPFDFRVTSTGGRPEPAGPSWISELYGMIDREIERYVCPGREAGTLALVQ